MYLDIVERIITEDLSRLGWQETALASRRKGDSSKMQLAARQRRETTLSVKPIVVRLHLGTSRSASIRLHTAMTQTTPAQADQGDLGV